jgi:uncharacterized membrane protein
MAQMDPKEQPVKAPSPWRWSWVYYDAADKNLWVKSPAGWAVPYTINAGHPLGPWVFIGITVLPNRFPVANEQ